MITCSAFLICTCFFFNCVLCVHLYWRWDMVWIKWVFDHYRFLLGFLYQCFFFSILCSIYFLPAPKFLVSINSVTPFGMAFSVGVVFFSHYFWPYYWFVFFSKSCFDIPICCKILQIPCTEWCNSIVGFLMNPVVKCSISQGFQRTF